MIPLRTLFGKPQARLLQRAVDEALAEAEKLPPDKRYHLGAVNWADLKCSDVERRSSLINGSTMVAVVIEEAAPDAVGLQQFVGDWLENHRWPNIYVVTEW